MTASQPSLLELAKQGDATAIAALMNHHLQPKGVTATAMLEEGCLQVALESQQVPNQPSLIEFVQKGVTNLGVDAIKRVRVYGVQTGKITPIWEQEIPLQRFAAIPTVPPADSLPIADVTDPPQAEPVLDSIPLVSTASASTASMTEDELWQEPVEDSSHKEGIGSFLGRHWTVVPMMLLAALLGFAAVVFLMGRGARSPQPIANSPTPSIPDSSPVATPATNSPTATSPAPAASTSVPAPAGSPSVSPPSPSPSTPTAASASPTATPAPAVTPFSQALTVGYSAAVNTQTAATRAEWDAVVSEWQQAIELLGKVASTDTNYATAQQKITEYQGNLTYARRRLQEAIAP